MSLSTEQIERLAELCKWYRQLWYSSHYKEAGGDVVVFVVRDQGGLTLAGERIVIEKLELSVKHSPTDGVWFVTYYVNRPKYKRESVHGDTLSQAIEAAVKAWLEEQQP